MVTHLSDQFDTLRSRQSERRYRHLPAAVTPLAPSDIATGIAAQWGIVGRQSITAGITGRWKDRGMERFSNEIAASLDADDTGSYTSFRRALCACLLELKRAADPECGQGQDRQDVLLPAFCSSDHPSAIEGAGLTPVRYDVDPATLSLSMDSIEALPTEDALALIVINVLGYTSPMKRIRAYCEEREIYLIEALGYAFGSEYRGERLGTFGDCSVLNFQQGKPIPVGGGMVVSRNDSLEFTDEGRPQVAPNVGALAGYAAFGHPRLYYLYSRGTDLLDRIGRPPGRHSTHPEAKFDVPYEPPFATMSEFQGTIGSRVLDRLPEHRNHRAATARVYETELADCPHVEHVQPVDGLESHQYVRYPLLIDDPDLRDDLQTALATRRVETAALYDWPPIDAETFPGAARLQEEIITLPTHPYVDDRDRERIIRTVRDVLGGDR